MKFFVVLLVIPPAVGIQMSSIGVEADATFKTREAPEKMIGAMLLNTNLATIERNGAVVEFAKKSSSKWPMSSPEEPTVNIEFGGDEHGHNSQKFGSYLVRPEAVKSKACNDHGCEDCSVKAKCFHGATQEGWGYTVLNVEGGSNFTYYSAEIWARCPSNSTKSQWWLEVDENTNGRLEVYVDDIKVEVKSRWTEIPLTKTAPARIRVLFFPIKRDRFSSAKIWLEAYKVDPHVDACMGLKDCLDLLADGSDAGFELRNDNEGQRKCLKGELSNVSSQVLAKCSVWAACVTTSGQKPFLIGLLDAGFGKGEDEASKNALLEGVTFANKMHIGGGGGDCVDPKTDDPEAWDCECAQKMMDSCKDKELEPCLKTLMCNDAGVCESWKNNECTGASMEERSQESTEIAMAGNLDGAMQGKCQG